MVKGPPPVAPATGPQIYSATYSNIPVYEFQFGTDLKEHVMRRRSDDWINATHILKASGYDKPARTRILERDVQKLPQYEKIQGGYGKYQGTWIPLPAGEELAKRNRVWDTLRPIFEFRPGNVSPPPAPKHTTNKPKAPKKPAVPKFNMAVPTPLREASYDNISTQLNDDETPDDTTVASQSFMGDPDDYNIPQSQQSTTHRKRKRNGEETPGVSYAEQQHTIYADELLDYFMLSQDDNYDGPPLAHPEPPPNFQPNWIIDTEGHTALSWACSMGDVEVMKQLRRFGADIACRNIRNETPFMRSVLFVNCFEKNTFPEIVKELFATIHLKDDCNSTVIHHAAALTHSLHKFEIARYYLDVILNKIEDECGPEEKQKLLDAQDIDGNTAAHIAGKNSARKCVRALLGRGAYSDIPNNEGVTVGDMITHLNNSRPSLQNRLRQGSSSPYAPNQRMDVPRPSTHAAVQSRAPVAHHSEAAMTVESKIAPTMAEKFRDLAQSFDDEMVEMDSSEKEARRLLNTTQDELRTIQDQIQELRRSEEQEATNDAELAEELAREQAAFMSVLEQRQAYELHSLAQREDSRSAAANATTMNGTHSQQTPEQALAEKNETAIRLVQEMEKRKTLVMGYAEARSKEGGGKKAAEYRKLVIKTLGLGEKGMEGMNVEELEEYLDQLVEVMEHDKEDGRREIVDGREE